MQVYEKEREEIIRAREGSRNKCMEMILQTLQSYISQHLHRKLSQIVRIILIGR